MFLPQPLLDGTLIRRYKRFLADVRLADGTEVTAHCPNSGSMKTCSEADRPVLLSKSDNPKRKYPHTWELIKMGRTWVGVNTQVPNKIVYEAIRNEMITELQGYSTIMREKPYGDHSRFDIYLENDAGYCYVEIKNVTYVESGIAYFPDAVTSRGTKHLNELMCVVQEGGRAAMVYVVQRGDCSLLKPAWHIDRVYAQTLSKAVDRGVEVIVYRAAITKKSIELSSELPYKLDEYEKP